MDLLLTHAYFLAEDPHERQVMKPYPPLGILYLSAYLKSQGFGVEVFDATFQDFAAFERCLREKRPPVVGIYVNLITRSSALRMVAACRVAGARVVLGGPEPAEYAAEYLQRGADVIVAGEGEHTLAELLPLLPTYHLPALERISGLILLDSAGDLLRTPPRPYIRPLDSLPFPDREAIDVDRYVQVWRQHHGMGAVSLTCARGCPYHCKWCSHAVYGETHRRRSPESVAGELVHLIERYRADQVWYADDVFTIHRRWFFQYAEVLKRRGLKVPFECISRADCMDEAVADALAEMGCYRLWIGSESGSQRVLDAMRREVKVEQVQHMTRVLQARRIQVGMFIMLGYEGEQMADIEATAAHLKAARPDTFLTTVTYPIKGTPFYRELEVQGRLRAQARWEQSSDRELGIAARHSDRFYSFATRWMVNSVALDGEWRRGPRRQGMGMPRLRLAPDCQRCRGLAKRAVNAGLGRAGMWLTRGQQSP